MIPLAIFVIQMQVSFFHMIEFARAKEDTLYKEEYVKLALHFTLVVLNAIKHNA